MKCLIHYGFSVRDDGDMRKSDVVSRFLSQKGLNSNNLVTAQQVHGTRVCVVKERARSTQISDADALVYHIDTSDTPVILGVRTADCVPILLYDPVLQSIAAVHSGWHGTLGGIVNNTVATFLRNGSCISDIHCVIGPHIRSCCYTVPKERAFLFLHSFGKKSMNKKQKEYVLDLTFVVKKQLMDSGIQIDHIVDEKKCTSCNVHEYYSFRKETKETFGEILGFIAFSQ
jgi:polyphenol oxidase